MGRRKRGSKGSTKLADEGKRPHKFEEPDPNSEDFFYDDIDKFHLQKDKILLEENAEAESEEEEEEDEEVLALGDESEEDEDEGDVLEEGDNDEALGLDEIDEIFGDKSDGIPNRKAWGKRKKVYYDADVQDEDILASDEEAERAAEEEEKEALEQQKRMASELNEEDFDIADEEVLSDENETVRKSEEASDTIIKDLSQLSKEQKLEILLNDAPELPMLVDEYHGKLQEIRDLYYPLFLLTTKGYRFTEEGKKYICTKYELLLNYCVNISFYLYLKSKQVDIKDHPVIDRILQHQLLLQNLEVIDRRLQPQLRDILANRETEAGIVDDSYKVSVECNQVSSSFGKLANGSRDVATYQVSVSARNGSKQASTVAVDPLEYYNKMKAILEQRKTARKTKHQVVEEEADELTDEESKRGITYEMAKNKGLTRKRRKELKNPRVKHKTKFRKALIKRKGQVREVVKELQRYGGERTGIKKNITKSVKIK